MSFAISGKIKKVVGAAGRICLFFIECNLMYGYSKWRCFFLSEERLDRIENMMTDMIRIVGSTNAIVAGLKADVAGLKEDMASVKKEQELFRQELFAQSERIDSNHREVITRLDNLEGKVDYSLQVLQRHDIEIFNLKKKIAING
jgi:hypothetical protein